jgi:hypothetical protein
MLGYTEPCYRKSRKSSNNLGSRCGPMATIRAVYGRNGPKAGKCGPLPVASFYTCLIDPSLCLVTRKLWPNISIFNFFIDEDLRGCTAKSSRLKPRRAEWKCNYSWRTSMFCFQYKDTNTLIFILFEGRDDNDGLIRNLHRCHISSDFFCSK